MAPPRPQFYGRRHGHRLNASRQQALATALPALTLRLPESGPVPLPPSASGRFRLEIGFGTGEHLASLAGAHPEIGFLGCEPFVNGQAALAKQAVERGLRNLAVWPDDARLLLPRLPDGVFERIYLLFSDPWPKTRHHRRRFLGPATLPDLTRLLAPGGELRVATDDPGLASWSLDHALRQPGLDWTAERAADWRTRPAESIATRYEEKARAAGRSPLFLSFRRI